MARDWKGMRLLLCLYVTCLSGGLAAQDKGTLGENRQGRDVVILLGSLKVTNRSVEMRCEIRNDTEQDIWVYDYDEKESQSKTREIMDRDLQGIVFLKGMDWLYHGEVYANGSRVPYTRLRPGESRPEVFSSQLPIEFWFDGSLGFLQAIDRGVETITRLTFKIGYYTKGDLVRDKQVKKVQFEGSGDRVMIWGLPGQWKDERSASLTVEPVKIPFKQWLDQRKHSDQNKSLPTPKLTRMQVLQDLFYEGSLSAWEYRCGQRVFSFDEVLFEGESRKLADIYTRMAKGSDDFKGLKDRLDAILDSGDPENMFAELKERQDLHDQKRQARVEDLLFRGRRIR